MRKKIFFCAHEIFKTWARNLQNMRIKFIKHGHEIFFHAHEIKNVFMKFKNEASKFKKEASKFIKRSF